MKKVIFTLIAILCVSFVSADLGDFSEGLVTHLKFDGADNGITFHNALLDTVDGRSAVTFDGNGDSLTLASPGTNFGTGDFTISFWAKPDSLSDPIILDLRSNHQTAGVAFHYSYEGVSGGLRLYAGSATGQGGPVLNAANGAVPYLLEVDVWKLVTLTRESGSLKYYVNGDLDQSQSVSFTGDLTDNTFRLGSLWDGSGFPYDGAIDELGIWSRALSEEEIREIFVEGSLVADYPLDGNANDESGNDNHGTVQGAIPTQDSERGNVYSFDGVDDYIDIGGVTLWDDYIGGGSTDAKPFSVSFWTKFNDLSPHQILWNVGGSQGYRRVSLESGEIKFSIPGDNIQGTVRTQALNSNVWYHVVATFEGGDPAGAQFGGMKLYVDGVGDTISVSDLDNPYPLTSYNAVQGIGSLNGVYPTNGHFDDVIIYNTALTDSEVESLYRDTLPPTFSASFTDGAKEGWEIDSYDSSSNPRFRNVRFENLNDEMVFEIPNMDMEDQEWENRVFQVDSQNGRVLVKIFDSASLEVPIAKFLTIPLSPGNDLVRVWNSINSINDMDSVSPDSVYSTEEISNGDITLVAGANTLISKVESVNSQEYAYVPVMNSGGEGGNSTCGNGVVEGNETCDDGNVANGDGCDEYCQTESGSGSGQGAVPEFSDYAIALLLLTVVGGFVAMRRRQ